MATEAFALSPMSARAAEPNEQDYDAIREAFMETARGRWFLGEYAKRNRNADTSMVLDAVARIEETLAAQRQPVVEDKLPEALVAIRRAVAEAESAVGEAFNRAALEASLGPINRGVRIVREISWRWREIGADGRICDLIDSQLAAIESACAQISAIDPRAELKAAFDLLKDRVEQTGGGAAATPQAASASPASAPVQHAVKAEAPPVADIETATASSEASEALAETPERAVAAAFDVAETEQAIAAAEVTDMVGAGEAVAEVASADMVEELSTEAAADAEDEAVLEMVALEMAAPDADFDEVFAEPAAAEIAEPAAVAPEVMTAEVTAPEVTAAEVEAPIVAEVIAQVREAIAATELAAAPAERPTLNVAQTAALPMPSPLPEPSLGSTILESGMLQRPRPANDPLAPIRRMTQAEKIAFFS